MRVGLPVDMSGVEAKEGFEVLPADNYKVRITKCEYKANATEGKSDYLNLEYEVVDHPEFNGRKLFGVQVIPSAKDPADKLATNAGMFKAFLEHFNLLDIAADFNTEDLLGATSEAQVGIELYTPSAGGEQKQKNKIVKFL